MPDQSVRPTHALPRLLCLLICALCLDRQAGLQAAESAVVETVSATAEQISIALSAPASFRQASLKADPSHHRPYRCYVDIAPARLGERVLSSLNIRQGEVQRVRVAQFRPDTARVVLDLAAERACQVRVLTKPYRLVVRVARTEPVSSASPIRLAAVAEVSITDAPPFRVVSASDSQPGVTVSSGSPAAPPPAPEPAPTLEPTPPATPEPAPQSAPEPEPELDLGPATAAEPQQGPLIPLAEAYRLAVQNEERIKIASHELGKARLLPWRALTHLTPRADIQGTYSRNKDEISFVSDNILPEGAASFFSTGSAIRPLERWTGIFRITQPILEPAFFASRQLGKASVRESAERYEFTIREVLFGVARAYYGALRSQAQMQIVRDTLGLTQDELRQAQVRFRVGEVTKTDVLRAEVAVEQARRQLVMDHNRLRLAFTTLARAIGVPEPLGVAQPEPVAYSPVPYDRLLDQAYSQRQDFRAQEIGVEIATQRKNLVIARYAPRVNARWDFPRLDAETFAERDKFWTLFLNFEVPLFDGGARELDLLEENERLAQAQLRVDQLRKEIQVEVRGALLTVETLGSTLQTLEKEVSLAQENYTITSKQYRVGLSTSLDVNTALNALNQVRTQLTDQTYAYQIALLRLQQTTGVFAADSMPQR
ncbi:MAG: TolC family protein [Desulfurellaceae bacterium]|nr:TolC family protein [Desulfurellaceae bacterium]